MTWVVTVVGILVGTGVLNQATVYSQEPVVTPASPMVVPAQGQPNKPPEANGQPADGKKPDKKDGDKENQSQSKVVKRPTEPSQPPEPIRQEVTAEESGKVRFSLKGQPWENVLQWLADESRLSLDWQELPGDYLNLTTTRSYTLEEARDLLNRHLLTRGYCMLLEGEILNVVKVSDLNAALVPRVMPDELAELPDHSLVKVSFDLDWLIADEAVEEFQPLLSSAGRINKLSRTNRLEIIDTASSLRDIWEILQAEQSDTGHEQLVRTFRLEHRRAGEVIDLLRSLLGMEDESSGGGGGSMDPNMMQQMQRQMQQMQQQMQNAAGKGGAKKDKTETRLVLNQRENMILVQAAPDQMAIIDKAIQQIDVPGESTNSLLQNINRMKVYRLETIDPQTLTDLLQELGDLDPGTVLKVDDKKKSIVAWASLADHLTITTLVERLDQSGRSFEVIPLKRLDAEYVAGTIRMLMGSEPEEDTRNSRSRNMSYYVFGMAPQQNSEPEKGFRVDADLQENRLLIYANSVEMEEIKRLLQKLGELPDPNVPDDGLRVFELSPSDDPDQLMRQLKQLWRRGNELQIELPTESDRPAEEGRRELPGEREDLTATDSEDVFQGDLQGDAFLAMLQQDANERTSVAAAEEAIETGDADVGEGESDVAGDRPAVSEFEAFRNAVSAGDSEGRGAAPVKLSVTEDGRLIVSSEDIRALNDMEDLLRQIVHPPRNYKVFHLQYATASWVTLNLEDYFKADAETESTMTYDPFFGYRPSQRAVKGNTSLSRRRQPQFIYDNYTSTILVRDADARQMQTIEELIRIYDVPEPADTRAMRVTQLFRMQNAKATTVAEAIKDVFRDLLSSNDKALQKNGEEQRETRVISYFGGGGDDGGDDENPIRFKGLLSIGVDPNSNTLIISSTAALMETIGQMVEELDKAAVSASSVQVLKLDPTVDVRLIQERLNSAFGQKAPKQPGPNGNGQPGQGVPVGQQPPGAPNGGNR